MAAPFEDSKIVAPFMPTLFHISLAKVAVQLYNRFNFETLEKAFAEIQRSNSEASGEGEDFHIKTGKDMEYTDAYIQCGGSTIVVEGDEENGEMIHSNAIGSLLLIPGRLRNTVLNAVKSMHWAAFFWRAEYLDAFKMEYNELDCLLHWRSDGTIDSSKTAQELVANENIDIRKRFVVACVFCFEERIQNLWTKLEASGEAKNLETTDSSIVNFWIKRMRGEPQVQWTQDFLEYFHPFVLVTPRAPFLRLSSFFPLLLLEDRRKFLTCFHIATRDDSRACLYAMTRSEEEQILQRYVGRVLRLYLEWPLQSLFLDLTEKVWNYFDDCAYRHLLWLIFRYKERKDFDYCNLLKDFWDRSPAHLRESAKQSPVLKKEIDSCFPEKRRKRQATDDETNSKFKNKIKIR